ncbi:6,7-dimethyl-8-ribityllumazine synthase [Flindersiella endophytica]
MSGAGAPVVQPIDAGQLGLRRVGVVAASWHEEIMDGLLAGAVRALMEAGLAQQQVTVVRVPGTFELSVAAAHLARTNEYDALVALGVVIRGATPHFDYVCQAATVGLTKVTVETCVPVGFGVLTCDTVEQARERAGLPGAKEDKGYEAAQAALATVASLAGVPALA